MPVPFPQILSHTVLAPPSASVPQSIKQAESSNLPAFSLGPISTAWFWLFPHPCLSVVPKAHSFSKPLLIFSYMLDKVLEC